MTTIDCHTHCYPKELHADPTAWAKIHNELYWASLVEPVGRPSIQGWATVDEMLEAMDAAGVDKAVLLGWYWENEATCRWHNEFIAEWVATAPKRFIGFAAIHPGGKKANVIEQCNYAQSLGLRGIGELHPGVQQFDASSEGWQALANWCVENDWPVNMHATEVVGRDLPSIVPTPLSDFVNMARANPELKIILAHWGGGLAFFELNPFLRKVLQNVYYDTAASPLLYDIAIFRQMIDIVGAEKILFGSDYPLRLYPRSQQEPDFTTFINSIDTVIDLSAEERAAIFHHNLQKLLPDSFT
ncbi:MAG: putative TIM-barrel fold metal-dependent hydrolase [Lentimonas sp.]|jgi:predicted TIM-barrel fold metal-dependent hydrolase